MATTWRDELATARATCDAERIDPARDGTDGLYIVTAAMPWELPTEVEYLVRAALASYAASWWDLLNADKGSICALLVDLSANVVRVPNLRYPDATWYPESLPSQQWVHGPRGEQPVAAHVLAFAAGRDEPMDRGALRGSAE
ncbi:MAG: hypothetical protein MOGMAGMI_02468 [Candidatus Omnitrophica bacterium]|nr:hypothetical protein [Candidatus Omnitrophota bacterium]